MKKLFFALFFGVAVAGFSAFSTGEVPAFAVEDVVATDTLRLQVEGMTCPMGCARGIEGMLNATEGILFASVDFDEKLATIAFDNTVVEGDVILTAINTFRDGAFKATHPKICCAKTAKPSTCCAKKNKPAKACCKAK